ncbi:MAG TPA: zinc-binding dehydrogenase [Methylomirabilota bacterium]
MGLPRTALAAVFRGPGQGFELTEYPLMAPVPGGLVARVLMSTVCGSDLHSWLGRRTSPVPGILGHEIVGTVAALGEPPPVTLDGRPLVEGDRITWTEYIICGNCRPCQDFSLPQKCVSVRKYGHEGAAAPPHLLGGFAQFCHVLPGSGVLRVPEPLDDCEAVAVNCGVATMVAVVEAAAIEAGDAVLVQGVGLLGLYGIAMARSAGAGFVIAVDRVPERLELAYRFGADLAIDLSGLEGAEAVTQVREACARGGADVGIETCGAPTALPEGLSMLRIGGRYVSAGLVSPGPPVALDAHALVTRCLTVRGVHNYRPAHLGQALDFVARHRQRWPLGELVDQRFSLAEVDAAFSHAAARRLVRPAIVP